MLGRVHSYQSMGTLDGPGVRFVVFLQGCGLRCAYCHNPDTWDCTAGAEVSAEEALKRIRRFIPYIAQSGGVTLSGGEPLLQAAFAAELLSGCKALHLHTALDTSGSVLTPAALKAAELADLILLDVKFTTEEDYKRYTGGSLQTVLRFMGEMRQRQKPLWVRQVILPGINDTEADLLRLYGLIKGYPYLQKVQLLPFHKLCLEKYEAMGIPFPLAGIAAANPRRVEELEQYIHRLIGIEG